MVWVLVFLMASGPGENFSEWYRLTSVEFESKEECIMFVGDPVYNRVVRDHLKTQYPLRPVQSVYCMTTESWEKVTGNNT